MALIRAAVLKDVPQITEIYNEAILNSVVTFETIAKTVEEQTLWFNAHDDKSPILVCEKDGRVVGWCSLSQWLERSAYAGTVELSTYVHSGFRRQGIGRQLKQNILIEAKKVGVHTVLSRVTSSNLASIRLNEKLGFKVVGTLKEVGFKFGQYHDDLIYQIIL